MSVDDREELAAEFAEFGFRETDDPDEADRRAYYKVEKWSRDGQRVIKLAFVDSTLDKAQRILRSHGQGPVRFDWRDIAEQRCIGAWGCRSFLFRTSPHRHRFLLARFDGLHRPISTGGGRGR
jgi:hypothetical protein